MTENEKEKARDKAASDTEQIKSRERVRSRGEVFTAPREVNAMLDLVKDETENIDSTFLEPACGTGNFLDEVLRRKLAVCAKKYGRSAADYEKNSFLACTTLYGVDIMSDNVLACRDRLYKTWEVTFSTGAAASSPRRTSGSPYATGAAAPSPRRSDFHDRVASAVKVVFEKNILLGNALSMKRVDENQNDLSEPIVFTEWKFAVGEKLKREEFRFDVLLEKGEAKKDEAVEMTFDFFGETSSAVNWMIDPDDPEKKRMIPAPSKTYPLIDYWRLGEEERK